MITIGTSIRRPTTLRERIDFPRRITFLGAAAVVDPGRGLLLAWVVSNGIQLFTASGIPLAQILSPTWDPDPSAGTAPTYGLLPFILGTLGVMFVAAIV